MQLVHVHGHAQCGTCGTVVDACCSGAGQEIDADVDAQRPADPAAVAAALRAIAPDGAWVTEESLLHAICARHACDSEAASAAVVRAVSSSAIDARTAPRGSRSPCHYRVRPANA